MKKLSMATVPQQLLSRASSNRSLLLLAASLTGLFFCPAAPTLAQTVLITDTFTNPATTNRWLAGNADNGSANLNNPAIPCLTASPLATNPPPGAPTSTDLGTIGCPTGSMFLTDGAGNEGALRLTSNDNNQAGFVLYQGPALPSSNGLVITFDFFSYNGNGADGISFFLVDGSASPSASGAFGGSLGYAQKTTAGGAPADVPGIAGGYFGVGFDEFGNYPNPTEGRTGSSNGTPTSGPPTANVSVRGAGAGFTGYNLIANSTVPVGVISGGGGLLDRSTARRTARITLTPAGDLTVEVNSGGGFTTVINTNVPTANGLPLPPTFRFGFGASTGGQTNYHEIKNFQVATQTTLPDLSIVKTASGTFAVGSNSTFNLSVANGATAGPTTGAITVTDTLPAGLNIVSATGTNWNCTVTGQSLSCTYTGGALAAGQAAPPIVVTVLPTAAAPASITNSASVTTPGDFNTANNTSSVTVPIVRRPLIGLAKQAGTPIDNGNGTFTIPYTFRVRNYGNVDLTNVQITEDLSGVYSSPATFAIAGPPVVTDVTSPNPGSSVTANAAFTGRGATVNLLGAAGQTLTVGASATITLNVIVTPNNNFGPYVNQARATATDPNGAPVFDDSTNGANPDDGDPNTPANNNDGDPTNNNIPTRTTLPNNNIPPRLGVAKQVGTPTPNDDGSYTVTYTVLVKNFGSVPVSSVQLVENLFGSPTSTFAGATSVTVVGPPTIVSGPLTAVNPAFNGNSNQNLLAGTETLGAGQSATLNFTLRVVPGNNTGPYLNVVTANGVGPNGQPLPPQNSVDQTGVANPNPDLNGDGDPSNDVGPNTRTPITFGPRFRLLKRITSVTRNGTLFPGVNFGGVVTDADGLAAALGAAGLPAIGVPSIPTTTPLASGDEVEYTVYFLSDGSTAAIDSNLCDQIPTQATLIADSNRLKLGSADLVRGGTVFSPIAPLPANNSCPDQSNPNGSLIFNLGNVPSTRGSNTGFVQFRVRIN